MPIQPTAMLEMARRLPGDGGYEKETRTRASLGRAYYSVFCAMRVAIRQLEGKQPDDEPRIDHGPLQDLLFSQGMPPELTAIGVQLQQLYAARRVADYDFLPKAPWDKLILKPATADQKVKEAQGFLSKLAGLDLSPLRGRI